jgi:acetamidase/formamidase
MKTHHLAPPHTHDRWNSQLPPALEIESGDVVVMECLDSSGSQISPDSRLEHFTSMDRDRIHTITGPVFVKDARPGDVLEVRIRRVEHHGWGWSSMISGLGCLPDRFKDPFLFLWKLEGELSRSIPNVTLPLAPFLGITGVCPLAPGEHRTRPPGPFGGNLDVRDLVPGSVLYLPIFQPGALFSAGDGHAAQGNGEVCINGIEAPMTAEFQLTVRRDIWLDEPQAEFPPARPSILGDTGSWGFISSAPITMEAVRNVVNRAIDFLGDRFGLSPELAYILCSVSLDLRLSQVVNQPMVTVTGTLPKSIFQQNA